MQEHHVASGAFHQGADGGLAVLAQDQVALPVPGYRPVLDLRRPLADVDHARYSGGALNTLAPGPPQGSAAAQTDRQLLAQGASALDVDRLVDGFVGHPHLRLMGELAAQLGSCLPRTQLLHQFGLDALAQPWVASQLGRLGSAGLAVGTTLSPARSVVPGLRPGPALSSRPGPVWVQVAAELAEYGRWGSLQAFGDQADGFVAFDAGEDLLTLREGEVATGGRCRDVGRNHPASLTKPFLAGVLVEADRNRCPFPR